MSSSTKRTHPASGIRLMPYTDYSSCNTKRTHKTRFGSRVTEANDIVNDSDDKDENSHIEVSGVCRLLIDGHKFEERELMKKTNLFSTGTLFTMSFPTTVTKML
ncbi:hypothetical protein T440DRAFT_212998 [Plenodomus tracheiphilus IPT5]|uniref:Uncharacterized protein n=1 Tax=Plenodomus tracheiphilus IPT5 TaxID=1408161 RepID=A0A6A7AW86_9PLEO|nr:hypothetical protein T440DRAFT_212998 [Plenodomus tracheiphilus IPT5]